MAEFNGGTITSDGGVLLLKEVEARRKIIKQFAACFTDYRNPNLIEHRVEELVGQRIYGLALGYEDLNDHDLLRRDPLLAAAVGKIDPEGQERRREADRGAALAGKSTLNRLELRSDDPAIVLCRPLTRTFENELGEQETIITGFVERPFWFVLSQTTGEPVEFPPTPTWDRSRALAALDVREVPFTELDGNTLGYARGREIAISPLSPFPHETFFHEVGHVKLGHSGEGEFSENRSIERNLKEVEAEAVALICCESLKLPGAEYARGYIQSWLIGDVIPEKSAHRILQVADLVLKAGQIA